MAVDTREPVRNYPIPDEGNLVAEEFPRLAQALIAVGVDVGALLTAVAGKAATGHTHYIAQVTGLQAALDELAASGGEVGAVTLGDLTDVDTTGAANFQVLARISGVWQPWTFDVTYTNGWAARLASSPIDAGQITTGLLDPARIPVLAGTATVISSGGIANLSAGQQAQVVQGGHVTTTDGRRWIYSGSGSKVLEAYYIELADVTPEWSVVANKPAKVTNLAGLSVTVASFPYFTGTGDAMAVAALSAWARTLLDDADEAQARATLGLGTMAIQPAASYYTAAQVNGAFYTATQVNASFATIAALAAKAPVDAGNGLLGSLMWGKVTVSANVTYGQTFAGSSIFPAGVVNSAQSFRNDQTQSGTWQSLGGCAAQSGSVSLLTLFQRVA